MHRHARSPFTDRQPCCSRAVVNALARQGQERAEHGEFVRLADGSKLGLQTCQGQFEQREGPLPVEDLIRGKLGPRIGGVTTFREGGVERQVCRAPATACGGDAPPFLGHETFQRREHAGIPRLHSNLRAAPMLGEAGILWPLSIQPAKGFPVKTGGSVPTFVYIVLLGVFLFGVWRIADAIVA